MSLIEQKLVPTHFAYNHPYHSSLCVRHISHDAARQDDYQRLRAAIFVHQLKWEIFVDEEDRERDHYDQRKDPSIHIYGVYGYGTYAEDEYLLAGVRIFELGTWKDSMTANEFHAVGMIPDETLASLASQHDCHEFLELTRFCVQRGRWYTPLSTSRHFSCVIARDLAYAAVYHVAEKTSRWKALALVDTGYLKVMKRSHFVFQEVYSDNSRTKSGYALTVIDLKATILAICKAGEISRAERMMALCTESAWQAL